MDGTSRTCLNCQAELRPSVRFCPKCGQQQSGLTVPAELPSGYPPQQAPGQPFQQPPSGTMSYTPPSAPFPTTPGPYPAAPAPYPAQPYGQPAPPAGGGRPVFESFRPSQPPGAPPGQQVPSGPLGPLGPPRQPPRRHDGNRSGSSLALLILVPALVIVVVLVLVLAHPFSHPARSNAVGTTPAATPSGTGSASGPANLAASGSPAGTATGSPTPSSSPAVTQQQAAAKVASMLAQSGSDRSAIGTASNDVAACRPGLASDAAVFDKAASSRQSLLTRLAGLAGSATLPAAMIGNLTKAWQASIAADHAYAQWANDEIAKICVTNDPTDPGHLATGKPNHDATNYKTAFAAQWNPLAKRYGLTQYQQGQL